MRKNELKPVFVKTVPEKLDEDLLYVCLECKVVVHLCPCGCGEKVVLPICEYGWKYSNSNELITLRPSVGNFQFNCKSHYFITNNKIQWC